MYKYIYNSNSTTTLDKTWQNKINEALDNHRITAQFQSWNNENSLANILKDTNKTSTNSLVVIGNDQDFNTLISASSLIEEDIALGYIPIDGGQMASKLHIKSWEASIEALAQRRIHETTIYSVGKRYFLDSVEFNITPTNTQQPLMVCIDSRLNLRLPESRLRFENLSDDNYLKNKSPILFSAHSIHQYEDIKKDLLGGLRKKLKLSPKTQIDQIASLHGATFRIESTSEIIDNTGHNYKGSLWIGKNSRKLRLITGRQKQIQ